MKKIQVALYDKEGYMSCLVGYLCRKGRGMLETRLFSSLDMLVTCAEAGKIDVLLAGEEVVEEIRGLEGKVAKIMLLSEGNQVKEGTGYYLLFKYQSAQEIVKEVLEQIAEDDTIAFTKAFPSKRRVSFVGVYAPFGGSGVTEYALSLAGRLAEKEKVLYVSFEQFHSLDFLQDTGKDAVSYRGMSEVIFYLKQRKEKLALKLETVVVSKERTDYIFAVEDYRDLYSLNCEDIHHFLEVLSQQADYETIIFDIGCLSEAMLYLMEHCDSLYMPQAETKQQKSKEAAFGRLLHRENHEPLLESFQRIEGKGG